MIVVQGQQKNAALLVLGCCADKHASHVQVLPESIGTQDHPSMALGAGCFLQSWFASSGWEAKLRMFAPVRVVQISHDDHQWN
eukprot:3483570-Amphidinium_carterae.1